MYKISKFVYSVRNAGRQTIACARRCRSSWLTGWWTQKEQAEKMEGQGGGEAQGVADPKKVKNESRLRKIRTEFYFKNQLKTWLLRYLNVFCLLRKRAI
jgi:hypothetical protein